MTNCASRQHANDATRLRAPMPAWRLHASAASWPATRWSCSTATAARGNRRGAASIISRIEGFTGPSFLHDLPPWVAWVVGRGYAPDRSEEHTSELQSLMRISYAVFCLKKKTKNNTEFRILLTHHF